MLRSTPARAAGVRKEFAPRFPGPYPRRLASQVQGGLPSTEAPGHCLGAGSGPRGSVPLLLCVFSVPARTRAACFRVKAEGIAGGSPAELTSALQGNKPLPLLGQTLKPSQGLAPRLWPPGCVCGNRDSGEPREMEGSAGLPAISQPSLPRMCRPPPGCWPLPWQLLHAAPEEFGVGSGASQWPVRGEARVPGAVAVLAGVERVAGWRGVLDPWGWCPG